MKFASALLWQRRHALTARISAQRLQFERELGALRVPLRTFEFARGLGEVLMRHAGATAVVVACAGVLLLRGGLLARTGRVLHFAARIARWAMLARLGLRRLGGPA